MNEIIKQVEELNVKTYELFCKLDRYKDKMTESAYNYMADKLFTIYKEEFEKLYGEYDIECTRLRYELKERRHALLPRAWRVWWTLFIYKRKNKAAKLIAEKAMLEAETLFKQLEESIDRETGKPSSAPTDTAKQSKKK